MKPILPFGKYLLLERISVGGMAEVFKARPADDEAAKLLAIKRILPSMAEDADFITMFIDEARISGQLNHPHIAQIYELSTVGDSHFIAMEYVWGKDVLQMQNRFRRLKSVMPFPMAAYIAAKMAEALDYAHKKKGPDGNPLGIIHRDVSPQNVLVSYHGEVKVIDFGIAKAASRSTKTQAGVLKGKFGYMSPEQVSGLPLDRRSDVFAIGTILYEMITADRLFIAESDFATLEKVRNVDIKAPLEAVPHCPPEIDRIIRKALAKSVDERYQWAEEMAADLYAWIAALPQAFGDRELAAWMQEHFSVEMKREAQTLEEQQQAAVAQARGAGAAAAAAAALPAAAAAGNGAVPGVVPHGTQELNVDAIVSEVEAAGAAMAGESTQILNPEVHGAPPAMAGESTQILNPEIHGGALPLSSQATMIADGGQVQAAVLAAVAAAGGAPSGELSAESTRILSSQDALPPLSRPLEEMPSQATAILDTSSMKLPPIILPTPMAPQPVQIAPVPQPMAPQPSGPVRTPTGAQGQLAFHPPTSRVDMPLPYKKPTWQKDVLIGFGVAALIVGGALGFRYWKQGPRGTLVVAVSPPASARIVVDGVERGAVEPGKAFTLKDFPAGSHRLEVKSASGNYADSVEVVSGDVSAVTAVLVPPVVEKPPEPPTPPPAPATPSPAAGDGKPAPTPPSPAGEKPVAVALKGGDKPAASPSSPSPAPAPAGDKPAGDKPGATPAGATPAPAPTPAPAVAGKGHLQIKTDPPGADVSVNGKPIGLTPVEVNDVEISKLVRITVRKKGYATVAKYLDFEKEPDRVLDLTMLAIKGGKPEAGDAPAAPSGGDKPAPAPAPPAGGDKGGTKTAAAPAPAPAGGDKGGTKTAAAPAPAPGAPGPNDPGFLVANTQPWAKVLIDGRDTGKSTPIAPLSKLPLKPGKHTVTFVVDGKKYSYPIEVKPGETLRVIKTLGGDAPAAP